ncbi:hypothetical protein K440DRAFT_645697 [Wilcoxina mikolae CBS 423.85]|nr:hypothetical protein K440DRAFT_645697 [Wilcoxina mikolae CBS 423.85]
MDDLTGRIVLVSCDGDGNRGWSVEIFYITEHLGATRRYYTTGDDDRKKPALDGKMEEILRRIKSYEDKQSEHQNTLATLKADNLALRLTNKRLEDQLESLHNNSFLEQYILRHMRACEERQTVLEQKIAYLNRTVDKIKSNKRAAKVANYAKSPGGKTRKATTKAGKAAKVTLPPMSPPQTGRGATGPVMTKNTQKSSNYEQGSQPSGPDRRRFINNGFFRRTRADGGWTMSD